MVLKEKRGLGKVAADPASTSGWPTVRRSAGHARHYNDQQGNKAGATAATSRAISHATAQLQHQSHGSPSRWETRQGRRSEENAAPGTNPPKPGRLGKASGLYLHCWLDGQACRALVDTGATISLVRPGVLHNTGGPQLPGAWMPTATPLTSVTGAKMAMRGKKEVKVTVSGQECPSPTTRLPTTTSLPHSNRLPSPNQLCLPRQQQLSTPCGNEAAAGSTTSSASSSKAYWTETQTCSRCGMRTVPRPSWCSTPSTQTQLNPSVCGRTGCPLPSDWWQRKSHCVVYLDDLLVHTSDFQQALANLTDVLAAIRQAGLRLNPKKCQLLWRETAFLGHIVTTLHRRHQRKQHWSGGRPVTEGRRRRGSGGLLQPGPGKAERNYCVTRRELLAVVRALHHFRPYLQGSHFLLHTDHASLTWLLNFKDPEGQVARWLEQLQGYDFEIRHRAGRLHGNTDTLSCWPCAAQECRYCSRQEERDQLGAARRSPLPTVAGPRPGSDILQLLVPRVLRPDVLRFVHGSVGAGHFGNNKTLHRLRGKFHWLRCRHDVELHVHCCDSCTAQKGPSQRSRAPLQQHLVGAPMEWVGVDVLGPFPVTHSGNRYILVAMDYFTKWPEAFAVPDQSAATTAERLVEEMFTRFGAPAELHNDQGRNFESQVLAEVCKRLGVTKTRTTPLHPQSDGLIERFNRTLATRLAILASQHQRDWDCHQPTHPCCPDVRTGAQDTSGLGTGLKNQAVLGRSTTTGCGTASSSLMTSPARPRPPPALSRSGGTTRAAEDGPLQREIRSGFIALSERRACRTSCEQAGGGLGKLWNDSLRWFIASGCRPGAPGGATSRPASALQAPGNS
ncbi:hypothetical protein SKAU_G00281380 [Synaphobranchus kaupii]|uniref:Gypsy retrotransposon integrase-like protein 1 n=1 Tax=Synaphobranchus kaupii TaxID=118154 RepID=A0A9Q1EXA8_SYNKA|nr:hypothetical protein SKAU_G00281380 [Synaphobranchus kaupii]